MQLTISRKRDNQWSTQLDDVKKQLGQQLDHLAKVAAEMGRDAASQATNTTQDVGAQTAGTVRDLGKQAVKATSDVGAQAAKATSDVGSQAVSAARELPAGAAVLAAGALKGLQHLGSEIRKVRITREPPMASRGPDARPGIALLAGVGSGLALMYFYDPAEGRRRRALLRDKLTKWTRIGRQTAEGTAKDFRNRTVGVMHEARKVVGARTGMGEDMTEIASSNGYGSYENRDTANAEQSPFTEPQPTNVG
jgi:hypothetical protein